MFYSGLDYSDGADFTRYDAISNSLLNGDFNPTTSTAIHSPLFPIFLAFFKYITPGEYWPITLGITQAIIASFSVVFLAKSSYMIFKKHSIANFTGCLYSVLFPFFYWTHLASQESLFQSLFIITFYFILRYSDRRDLSSLISFSAFYSLAVLTKSHVILLIPGFIFIVLYHRDKLSKRLSHALLLIILFILINLPYGIFTLIKYDTFVISSNGGPGQYLFGHNDEFYEYLVETPEYGSPKFQKAKAMDFKATKIEGNSELTYYQRQSIYLKRGLKWTIENPSKIIPLVKANLINHLRPGYAFRYRELDYKIFIINLIYIIIYIPAYIEIYKSYSSWKNHIPMFVVIFGSFLFAITFYSQNRFRNITVDPLYLIYTSPILARIMFNTFRIRFNKK